MTGKLGKIDADRIGQWGRGLDADVTIAYALTGHEMDAAVAGFATRLAELAPRVRAKKEGDAMVSRPTLFINRQVAYQALPTDRELDPFLAVLEHADAYVDRIAADVRQRLDRLELPALFTVYVTPHCPHCPATVASLLGLSACSPWVRVTVIDGEAFPEAAEKDRISSAPTVVLDEKFRWTGAVDLGELVTLMLDRDPAGLGADALRGMIEDGDAEGVAHMMNESGTLFPAFLELLVHPRWSVRLGAMVVFETLAEENATLARQVVEPLAAVFNDVEDTVRGDILHVIGESGNSAALPFLTSVLVGESDDEVRDAAQEAIDKLT
jgi:glutaredoxin